MPWTRSEYLLCKHFSNTESSRISTSPGLKLLGAERVSDVFNGVTQAVGEVVCGVDAPGVP